MAQPRNHPKWEPISPSFQKTTNIPEPFVPAQAPDIYPSQMDESQFDESYPVPDEFLRTPSGSSVLETDSVMLENGRTYHGYKEGKYHLPNDAAEQDRLDMQHKLVGIILDGRLICAPMTEAPKNVIDIATGTGIWAIEFAQQNPTSHVIGTDLSAIQPDMQLPNLEFIKEDSEEEWIYSHKFDYIHLRFVVMAFDNPRSVLQQAVQNLNEGGWIEYHDVDLTTFSYDGSHEGTAMQRYFQFIKQGLGLRGRDTSVAVQYAKWLRDAGLVDVKEVIFDVPGCAWPADPKMKRIGQYMYVDLFEGVRGAAEPVFKPLGMSTDEIEQLVLDFKRQSADEKHKVVYKFYVVYGRKPRAGEVKVEP